MVKSTIKDGVPYIKETYPCLKQHIDARDVRGIVVLFHKPYHGTVVNLGNDYTMRTIGETSNGWAENEFKLITGKIELENT